VSLDYLAIDRARGRVWIPAGETGSVDVLDAATGKMTRVEGFPTEERDMRGQKRVVGPSSATIGEGFAYVGNRASSEICAVDLDKLVKGACLALPSPPDGLQYVAATKELWASTPRDKSIAVLDASAPDKLAPKTQITLDGAPEGYAIDQARGIFYTNIEDLDKTLVLDARTHKVTATWEPRCGSEGPRGLALDAVKGFLFVACTDQVKVLDAAHGGSQLSTLAAGGGIDNIDYLDEKAQVFIAAGKNGTLTVARVDDKGALSVVVTAPTAPGTRVVVAGKDGAAYVADGKGGRVLALSPTP
jgi:DNA-binding beta-propeller fold protein YncE